MNEAEADALIARHRYSERDVERILREGYEDHEAFCRRLKITHKSGELKTVHWTPSWAKLYGAINKQQRAGRPVRGLVLKSGQIHISAGLCAWAVKRTAFLPGQHTRIFCDVHKNAANLYRYCKTYLDHMEPGAVRPQPGARFNKDEKIWWAPDSTGSWIEFGSAERATGGRSASVKTAILDEFAFWRDAETLMTGLLQRVTDDPDSFAIIDSTANGSGGPFWERWITYSAPDYSGDWFSLFIAWWEHPENILPVPEMRRFQDSLTKEELQLRAQYNLSPEQLYWRRWTILNKCDGSIEKFHQEHPGCADEAFLTSGRPRFCHVSLGRMVRSKDFATGHLERQRVGTREQIQFVPHEDGKGDIRIFKRPAQGRFYVAGLDPAEGLLINETRRDPDSSAVFMADQETGEQVACIHMREMQIDVFADVACTLAEWFNWAFLVPLVNGMGLALLSEILHLQYPTHLIYHRERDPDDRRAPLMEELGFKESEPSRLMLVSNLDRWIRGLSVNICCPACVSQHYSFVIKPNGREEHEEGAHDDSVLAAAACVRGLQVAPRIRALMEARKPKPVDWDRDDEDDERRGPRQYRTVRR